MTSPLHALKQTDMYTTNILIVTLYYSLKMSIYETTILSSSVTASPIEHELGPVTYIMYGTRDCRHLNVDE